ncbi:hypothetical protein Tco_0359328 [Tanacetum coccineum]
MEKLTYRLRMQDMVEMETGMQGDRTGIKQQMQEMECAKGHYARDCPKPKVCDAKYFKKEKFIGTKDEAGGNLNDEENDFMLDNAHKYDTLEEQTTAVIMMARIQPANDNAETDPKYDVEAVSEVNASHIDLISGIVSNAAHNHKNHGKLKTVIHTFDDDQIDSNIIFDDPYVENNSGKLNMLQVIMTHMMILKP